MPISTSNLSVDMDIKTKHQFTDDIIAECKHVLEGNPGNRCAKYCMEYLGSEDGKNLDSKGERNRTW